MPSSYFWRPSTNPYEGSQDLPIRLMPPTIRPKVIGLYGVSGCGKTTLLQQLKQHFGDQEFSYYDGSDVLYHQVPGGQEVFRALDEAAKSTVRTKAIEFVRQTCAASGRTAIVAGHMTFWDTGAARSVWTDGDQSIYTHILYLNVPPKQVWKQRLRDTSRPDRKGVHVDDLSKWQDYEKTALRKLCYEHGILFANVRSDRPLDRAVELIKDFHLHSKEHNLSLARKHLDATLASGQAQSQTVLVLDGDKTLTPHDTGTMFWKSEVFTRSEPEPVFFDGALEAIFSSSMGYSYTAFRQATLLYEDACDGKQYETICDAIASSVVMCTEFVSLLQMVAEHKDVVAMITTCGPRRIWEKILQREGLSVQVIGGGRISDGFVMTAEVKAALVERIQTHHNKKVWAFGDGPLDLDMLKVADQAVVVVGDEKIRSRSMEQKLSDAVRDGLKARQVLLPDTSKPRLDTTRLPLLKLTTPAFVDEIFVATLPHTADSIVHATEKNAAKLLMTTMRDATIPAVALREHHRRVGWYLATEYLSQSTITGVETYPMPHVNKSLTKGYRFLHENKTTIVALMRAGEPMALGVNDAMPSAMFLHAKDPGDLKPEHVDQQHTIVLVDSVINTGKTTLEFLQCIRTLHATIRVVVVAGVVQEKFIVEKKLDGYANVKLVALRMSENQYKGVGVTDTGHRLFNTTQLE